MTTYKFEAVSELYESCFDTYSVYSPFYGHMHVPLRLMASDTTDDCLDNLNNIIIDMLSDGMCTRVIDLGCGRGALAISIAETFSADVDGISSSYKEVQWATSKSNDRTPKIRANFRVADMNAISPSGELQYDAVINADSECYFQSLTHGIRIVNSLLKPAGKWIVTRLCLMRTPRTAIECWAVKFIHHSWRIRQLEHRDEFVTETSRYFTLCKSIDFSGRIIDYYNFLSPVSRRPLAYTLFRYGARSVVESESLRSVPTVLKNRLAFPITILCIKNGLISYNLFSLRKS